MILIFFSFISRSLARYLSYGRRKISEDDGKKREEDEDGEREKGSFHLTRSPSSSSPSLFFSLTPTAFSPSVHFQKSHGTKNCENFDGTPISNRTTNDLARLRVCCSYAPNGCRVISLYYDLERHEQTCEFERIPCELCKLPLSQRPPIVQHTRRACFEHMRNKNPAAMQQHFMILFNVMEEAKAENHRLQSTINDMKTELKNLDLICIKKNDTHKK